MVQWSISVVKKPYIIFFKSNISTFSDFKLYLFLTVLFATLKTSSENNRGTVWYRPNLPVPKFWSGPNMYLCMYMYLYIKQCICTCIMYMYLGQGKEGVFVKAFSSAPYT